MMIYLKNTLGEPITESEELGTYHKKFINDAGNEVRSEMYLDGVLVNVHIDLANSREEELVSELSQMNLKSFGFFTTEKYGRYTIETTRIYRNNQFEETTRSLNEAEDKGICHEILDRITNQPNFELTGKYLGGYEDEHTEYFFEFSYNADGSLRYCDLSYSHGYDHETFWPDRIVELKATIGLSDSMFNYYLTAVFLPPLD